MKKTIFLFFGIALVLSISPTAFAHHAMGNELPITLLHGFIAGLAHPVIELDHLAFVVAVGTASAFIDRRLILIFAFVVSTAVGSALTIYSLTLPALEFFVTVSVIVIGGFILSGKTSSGVLLFLLFPIFGLFHGSAYGESVIGSESTPLFGYFVGFSIIQFFIALGCSLLFTYGWKEKRIHSLKYRLTGGVTFGVGLAILVDKTYESIFPF